MFNIFKKKVSISEYAESAEILPVAEEGDYKAFLVQVSSSGADFSSILQNAGGQVALSKFVEVIDSRIARGDFEDIFGMVDRIYGDYGMESKVRNLDAERIVISKGENGYLFKWGADT